MASKKSYAKLSSLFDEQEWVVQIRSTLEGEVEEEDTGTLASIFCVPKELFNCKPEAYAPQVFAFGPYHHWRTHLYDMERYKLAAARRVQARLLGGLRLHQVVQQFLKHEYKIRCHYHKYLDFNGETLVWMMVIDASFLIEFLQVHAANSTAQVLARSTSKRIENEKTKIFFNMMLRDIMMLENQMPLFLLRKLLGLQFPTKELASDELARVLAVFVKEVSPIKSMDNFPLVDDVTSRSHLLDLLYRMVVPKAAGTDESIIAEEEDGEGEGRANELGVDGELGTADSTGVVKKALNWGWTSVLSGINRGPMRIVKRVIAAKPVRLVVKFPWKVVSALPIFSIVKQPVEGFFSQLAGGGKAKSDDDGTGSAGHADRPPLAEEIAIPSVAELCAAGVQFLPRNGDVTTVGFDAKTATVYLPVVSLDVNTEVVLRNLVAYEASAVSGPLVFTRYTELMNGIIDTEEDVRMLRERGVVVNRMKSDGEAAALWNGMSKSVRLSKVGFLDAVIRDVNKYYRSRWRVKAKGFMKKYVFGSWQLLTLLAAALLLFLTCVQAFCSVYSCNSRLTKFSSVAN